MSKIQQLIEKSWEEDEYLQEKDKQWLIDNGLLETWEELFFIDLVERYQGTCNFLEGKDMSFLEDFNKCGDFDLEIFECTTCGWWCEDGDYGFSSSGENVCSECTEEEE